MSASEADRTSEYGDADQCPNERKPIRFTAASRSALIQRRLEVGPQVVDRLQADVEPDQRPPGPGPDVADAFRQDPRHHERLVAAPRVAEPEPARRDQPVRECLHGPGVDEELEGEEAAR